MNIRGYIFSRNFFGERIPQNIQSLTIRDYCKKNNLTFLLHAVEYSMKDSHFILKALLNELNDIDGIAAYSLFQMPYDDDLRVKIFQQFINKKKIIHFALESLKIKDENDIDMIEDIWKIKKILPSCYKYNL
tara:strand:+ start:3104 stop:3499 length:396 start_codon:yes stop_codon:yes gene_type:complete